MERYRAAVMASDMATCVSDMAQKLSTVYCDIEANVSLLSYNVRRRGVIKYRLSSCGVGCMVRREVERHTGAELAAAAARVSRRVPLANFELHNQDINKSQWHEQSLRKMRKAMASSLIRTVHRQATSCHGTVPAWHYCELY